MQWESCRQPFHTLSTAESELVGYCEAALMMKSIQALMVVLHGPNVDETQFEKIIYGDNSSAIAILSNPDGGWRTRHLRLRSFGLRDLLRHHKESWKIRHQKGVNLIADLLKDFPQKMNGPSFGSSSTTKVFPLKTCHQAALSCQLRISSCRQLRYHPALSRFRNS